MEIQNQIRDFLGNWVLEIDLDFSIYDGGQIRIAGIHFSSKADSHDVLIDYSNLTDQIRILLTAVTQTVASAAGFDIPTLLHALQ